MRSWSRVVRIGALLLLASAAGAAEYDYTVSTPKTLDEALDAVTDAAAREGLKVPGVHTLPAEGFQCVAVEVCDPAEARRLLAVDPKFGLLMPCGKIGVYQDPRDGHRTKISLLLPSALVRIHPAKEVAAMAEALAPRLRKIVEEAR